MSAKLAQAQRKALVLIAENEPPRLWFSCKMVTPKMRRKLRKAGLIEFRYIPDFGLLGDTITEAGRAALAEAKP